MYYSKKILFESASCLSSFLSLRLNLLEHKRQRSGFCFNPKMDSRFAWSKDSVHMFLQNDNYSWYYLRYSVLGTRYSVHITFVVHVHVNKISSFLFLYFISSLRGKVFGSYECSWSALWVQEWCRSWKLEVKTIEISKNQDALLFASTRRTWLFQ